MSHTWGRPPRDPWEYDPETIALMRERVWEKPRKSNLELVGFPVLVAVGVFLALVIVGKIVYQ